jgi:hypothetical protein
MYLPERLKIGGNIDERRLLNHSNGEKDFKFKIIASNISPVINPCFIIQKCQEIYK